MSRSGQNINPSTGLIVGMAFVLAMILAVVYLKSPDFIEPLEHSVQDAIVDSAPAPVDSERVVIVDIDEASLAEWGQWPWRRAMIADLLARLADMGAGSIGLTFIMAEPDRSGGNAAGDGPTRGDDALAAVLADGPFVLGYEFHFDHRLPADCPDRALGLVSIQSAAAVNDGLKLYRAVGAVRNIPALAQAAPHAGFLNGLPDTDGRLRRLPLLIECNGAVYPNLALAALLPTSDRRPLKLNHGNGVQSRLSIDGRDIPVDENGNLRIRFPATGTRPHRISAAQVLGGRLPASFIRDRIVLVGPTAAGLSTTYRAAGSGVFSAVDVHAQAVETMLSGSHIRRHIGTRYAEILFSLLVAVIYAVCIARFEFIPTIAIGGSTAMAVWGGAQLLFNSRQILFSPLLPITVVFSSGILLMLFKYWNRQHRTGKRLQEALVLIRDNERNLNAIIKTIPDIVFRLDARGCITFVSPAIAKYNYRTEDLIGRPILDLVAESDRPHAVYRINERRTGDRATTNLEVRLLLAPGDRDDRRGRYFSISAEGIYEGRIAEGKAFVGTQGIARDIDARKHLEHKLERSKKMEAIGGLAAGVAHDLNNILSGLVSYPELLLLDLPPESPMRGKIETIQRSGQRAADIVQDLLMIARRGVSDHMVINLNHIIGSFLRTPEFERLKATHPTIQVTTQLSESLMNIRGSNVHLQKMIMNLVGNAAEAMPAGGSIRIITRNRYLDTQMDRYERIDEGEYAVLRVIDEGVGISAEDLHRIFEPFYTKKQMGYSGSGLGMTVIWNTVKDHDGFVDIRTREGEGTCFDIYLPATRETVGSQPPRIVLEDYTGSERILVVDDVAEQRDIAVRMLGKLGYRVTSVASGEAAVAVLKDHPSDLVVLDMVMPGGMDGLETYRRILKDHPGQRVIVASGYAPSDRVKAMQDLGAGEYIRKPYTLEKIGLAVRRELDRK